MGVQRSLYVNVPANGGRLEAIKQDFLVMMIHVFSPITLDWSTALKIGLHHMIELACATC